MPRITPVDTADYSSISQIRDEGISQTQASDSRLETLIHDASRVIDSVTGWFFYPGEATFLLHGRGTSTLEISYPPIEISSLFINGRSVAQNSFVFEGSPIQPGFEVPLIALLKGSVFPKGRYNIEISGIFGYREQSSSQYGAVPAQIRNACKMLVVRALPLLGDADGIADAQYRWRLISEKTRDQSYSMAPFKESFHLTGEPEVDRILSNFMRPAQLGAV